MTAHRRKLKNGYHAGLEALKASGRRNGLSEEEIEDVYQKSLKFVKKDVYNETSQKYRYPLKVLALLILLASSIYFFNFYRPAHNFIERNIQEVIYPFMKIYRRLTLPIVEKFPLITELYDESCLVENPYFRVSDMECWPCENARFVINLTDSIGKAHVGLPFIQKINLPPVTLNDLQEAYSTFKQEIDSNSPRIQSNNGWRSVDQVLGSNVACTDEHAKVHIEWRINRMETGRALRHLLRPPRDEEVPAHATSIGIERFVLIDGPDSPYYALPSTEGSNVFIKQLSGQRLIVLEPSPDCRQSCRRLSLLLEESHILWYNWWYWRPRSFPVVNSSSCSVAFVGSSV